MKNRGTAALIALFFAGLVGLWVADSSRVPSARDLERQRGRILPGLVDLKPDDLQKIEIDGGPAPLIFERRDGRRWQMTAPLDVAADPSLVEGLAVQLKGLTRKPQADTLTGDPATYGLAPARKTIRLWGQATDMPLATLELGNTSLDRRFVRAGVAGVEVVPAQGLEVVDLPPVRWRDRELFRVPTFEVDAVQLTTPGHVLGFERGPDAWRIVAPLQTLAEDGKVEGLIASLGSLRIATDAQFIANDVGEADWDRYGLKPPSLTIDVAAGRGSSRRPKQVVQFGRPVEGQPDRLYARVAGQNDVVAVDTRVVNDLARLQPYEFRNSRVADIAPNRATRFRVESAGESFEVARAGNQWFLVRPSPGRADPKAVQEFFQALERLRTTLYLPPTAEAEQVAGLNQPSEVIEVWQTADPRVGTSESASPTTADDKPTFTIKIGARDAGKKVVYAQTAGDTSILAVPDALTGNLFRNSWAFRDRLVVTAPSDQVERIQVDGLGRRVTLLAPPFKLNSLKNAAVGWWLGAPVVAPAHTDAVTKLLKLLAALRVDGYAAESPPSLVPYGLDHPSFKVTWATPAAVTTPTPVPLPRGSDPASPPLRFDEQTLLVGGPVPERVALRYAMIVGHPVVFMLGGETLATLDAEFHDHQVLKFDPARVDKIHLEWPGTGRAFNLTRADNGWATGGPIDFPGFDPGVADAALRASADLTTPRFLQYLGEVPATVGLTPPRLVLKFSGAKLAQPIELVLGASFDNAQGYAATPTLPPGAVFVVANTPFAPWLQLQPAFRDGLPEDVFLHEPPTSPPLTPDDRPGQTGGQPR